MSTSTMPFREERSFEVDLPLPDSPEMPPSKMFSDKGFDLDASLPFKRMRYYYRLESESSPGNTDDTESVYSIQDRETDVVKDTTDTDSHSEYSVDLIEYEIESDEEEPDDLPSSDSSSGPEPMIIAAAILGDSALEDITGSEDSDSSKAEDLSTLTNYPKCVQCKSENKNPLFRFCIKCYQEKRAFLPAPPRRRKKAAKKKEDVSTDESSIRFQMGAVSSQDSGIGSSQELMRFEFTVPLEAPSSSKSRKRQISESSLSDESEAKRPKKEDGKSEVVSEKAAESRTETEKELCMFCNVHPKDAVFLHGRSAHVCCCFRCAKRTYNRFKKCPICNRKINNIAKIHMC